MSITVVLTSSAADTRAARFVSWEHQGGSRILCRVRQLWSQWRYDRAIASHGLLAKVSPYSGAVPVRRWAR